MNIIELKDRDRTAWYRSDKLTSIAKVAEVLNRVIAARADPDIAVVENMAGKDLQPLTHQEYMATLDGFVDGSGHGFVAEIDLADDSGCFTQIPAVAKKVISVYGMISRITGIYQMSVDPKTGKLDASAFTEGLIQHCDWVKYSSPQERFGSQVQKQSLGQDMTMR